MRRGRTSHLTVVILISIFLLMVVGISVLTVKVWRLESEIEKLRSSSERSVNSLSKRIEKIEKLLGPNSALSKYIVDVNYVSDILKDVETIKKAIVEGEDDPTSAYFRVLVIGYDMVWFSLKKGDKVYFAKNCKPGLLPYKFYYFKPPPVYLDYIVRIPKDVSVTVGKPNRVFLIFFGVGSGGRRPVKIVKLTKTFYRSLVDDFHLYVPE